MRLQRVVPNLTLPAPGKSLAARHRALARQWHPTKNRPLTPAHLKPGSCRKVWWRCPKRPRHVWQATVQARTNPKQPGGCPFCSNYEVDAVNSLAARFPAVAREWHPTRNGKLRPRDVVPGTNRRVWWRCRVAGHEWATEVRWRTSQGTGCPNCRSLRRVGEPSLALRFPKLVREWHPVRNGAVTADQVAPFADRKAWWRCPRDPRHDYESRICSRTRSGKGCPYCAGLRLRPGNSLAAKAPAVARQWHPTKNGRLKPAKIASGSSRKVWWQCPKGPDHEWQAIVSQRAIHHTRCPYCAGRRVSITNTLAAKFPRLAAQWHPKKNGRLTPDRIYARSLRLVWWKCPNGPKHEWRKTIAYRANRVFPKGFGWALGCPFCPRLEIPAKKILATSFPAIAQEWHPSRNGRKNPWYIASDSKMPFWWRCRKSRGHQWRCNVYRRTVNGAGCPVCESEMAH